MPQGRIRRLALWLLALLFIYALLGFLVLPGVALQVGNRLLGQYLSEPAKIERVLFNPFTLELEVQGLRVGSTAEPRIALRRLRANLQLDSLWRGLHLAEVELQAPQVALTLDAQGRPDLAALLVLPEKDDAENNDRPGSEPFPLSIDEVRLLSGRFAFRDLGPQTPVSYRLDGLDLRIEDLSTAPDSLAQVAVLAHGEDGATLNGLGQLGLFPLQSTGTLQLQGAHLTPFWPYVREQLALRLGEGQLSLSGHYQLNLTERLQLKLDQVQARLAPLSLRDLNGEPRLNLRSLAVDDLSLDLAARQVRIGRLDSQGLETWATRRADGRLDWQELLPAPSSPSSAPANAPGEPWRIALDEGQLGDYRVHLQDLAMAQPVNLDIGPLALAVEDLDSASQAPFRVRLESGIGARGQVQAEGQATLSPPSAALHIGARDLDLRIAQAYLEPYVRLELRSGRAGGDLDLELQSVSPLQLHLSGDARVSQLHTLDTLQQRDFVRWQELDLKGIDYRHGERLEINRVALQRPYGRLIINDDLTTNLDELKVPPPAGTAPEPTAPASKPLAIRIGGVDIENGSANFADFSLRPNFAAAIQDMQGHVGTLSNAAGSAPAPVKIAGKVDRYAPVTIEGQLDPFDPLRSLDMRAGFHQVELTTLTPYSGKFAGYRIRKGRLDLDLHYRIDRGQLNAENHVLVDQLQLGERVDSPDAVDLPIRLAVALLKDSQGRIDISLPVSGNLDDPQFSVMPIVWQTLRNLLVRAVQAPFKLLGSLVSGGEEEDLGLVPFAPGSDELGTAARQTLDTLVKALRERPQLRLEVQGTSATVDARPLAEQRLERDYRETWYRILQRRGDSVPPSADELVVPDDEKPPLLEGIYRARLRQQPPAQWRELDEAQRSQQLRQALLQHWSSSQALQRRLAQARATRIREYLVEQGGLSAARVFLVDVSGAAVDGDGQVPSHLQLDADAG